MVGRSFTAVTVRTKLVAAVAWLSLTVTVIVAVPLWFAAGVTVTVRFAPVPPKTMLATGTRVVLDVAAGEREAARRGFRIADRDGQRAGAGVLGDRLRPERRNRRRPCSTAVTVSRKLSLAVPPGRH